MKKSWIIIGIIIVALIILYRLSVTPYNNMVRMEEQITSQWAQVENVYQRRADLIPNLVNTVKGYATFERETITKVIEARARATQVTINPEGLTPEALQKFQQAQGDLGSALSRLMVVVERYPELKANQNFLELQAQLEGSENRIAVERNKFNETVQRYNAYIRSIPNNIIASIFGFAKKPYFEAEAGAEKVPEVKF
ncbi:MAG: LemA family protein [Nitrospirae bacterium]|nr:LemA family protein [Nitrospirota bacterium]